MNEATATPETAAPAEGTGSENNSNGNSPQAESSEGLLASAGGEDEAAAPAPETPGTTPEPGTIADRPEYIAEQFWNTESGTPKVEELSKSYNELRNQNNKLMAEKGKGAPEEAGEYLKDYKPPHRSRPSGDQKEGDVLDRFGELDAGDPVFVAISKFAKNGNMSKGQFDDGMQTLMEELHGILPEPFNPEKEKGLLGEGAEQMIKTNRSWIDTLARNGVVNEDEFNLLLGFGSTALGVQLTNKLRLNSGEKPIPGKLNGNANTGRKTPDECQAMMADERYYADGPAGDAFRAEVDKAFAETFGTNPA